MYIQLFVGEQWQTRQTELFLFFRVRALLLGCANETHFRSAIYTTGAEIPIETLFLIIINYILISCSDIWI